jgi:hypothetical protein
MSVNPPTTFVRGPSIIWIISTSQGASEAACHALAPPTQVGEARVAVIATVYDDSAGPPLSNTFPANDPNLCALLLMIEPEAGRNRRFMDVLRWAIHKTAEREDFRLFVHVYQGTFAQFLAALPHEARGFAQDLTDTVQVANTRDLMQLCGDVKAFLEQLDDIRRESQWRSLRATAATLFLRLAEPVQVCAFVLSLGMALYVPVWDQHPAVKLLHQHKPTVAIICGVAFLPLLLLGLFSYSRFGPFLLGMHTAHRGILWAGLSSLCAPSVFVVMTRISVPYRWIAVGLTLGAFVDASRRRASLVLRARQSPDPKSIARSDPLPAGLIRQAGPSLPPPLACPIMPNAIPQVFISYTRTSTWSVANAHELRERITASGARCFLDTREIAEGTNWRSYLNRHLGLASVFVCLVDQQTLAREWPAAELEAALRGKELTGSPDIIVIKSPNLKATDVDDLTCLPVFRAVLTRISHFVREGQPQIVPFSDATIPAFAAQLRPNLYTSVSVLPTRIAQILSYLWVIPRRAINLTSGVVGPVLGNLAILFFIAEWISRLAPAAAPVGFNSGIFLSRHNWLAPIFLFCAVSLGFVARLSAASRFELKAPRYLGVYRAHRDSAVGFGLILMTWSPYVSAFVLCCSLVCCCTGWNEASYFVLTTSLRDPGFVRRVD